ncbi:unnamed protein product, partial [Cyprideis torosa]
MECYDPSGSRSGAAIPTYSPPASPLFHLTAQGTSGIHLNRSVRMNEFLLDWTSSMQCYLCVPSVCSSLFNTENCPRGIVKDVCGCCDICAKDLGETCGGPYEAFGKCGPGLRCERDLSHLPKQAQRDLSHLPKQAQRDLSHLPKQAQKLSSKGGFA